MKEELISKNHQEMVFIIHLFSFFYVKVSKLKAHIPVLHTIREITSLTKHTITVGELDYVQLK